MSVVWESISFADLITERKGRYEPDAPEIEGLQKIEKIDFSEGKLHLGTYEPTKTEQIIVEPGDFVFSGLNIEKGAAGFNETGERLVVSANYSTCSYDDSRVSLDFFKHYMRSANFQKLLKANLKKDYGFTRPKHLMPLSFPVPRDKTEQERIVAKYERCKKTQLELSGELTHQETLLGQLQQAILQEAIQGKLTTDWRAAHPQAEPARALLQRIQVEKSRLIAAKKLRPEKSLPPITPAEVPFEIPKTWEWCRLGEINLQFLGGEAYQSISILPDGKNQVVRIGNIKSDMLDLTKRPAFISDSLAEETSASQLHPGDILITMTGTYQKKDYCFTVLLQEEHFGGKRLYQNQRVGCFRLHPDVCKPFLVYALKLSQLLNPVFESSTGAANQANISKGALLNILIPLPPFAEQAAIVERVAALQTRVRALAAELAHSRTHAAHLLQAVLQEAFTPATPPK
jgi:type I restriction enzyme S subunit